LRSPDEYNGETVVAIEATQLDVAPAVASRIVREWCSFFAAGPSPILDLEFVSRTPRRLFASLEGQPQLRRLALKWGDYEDLTALTSMVNLAHLRLGGASSVIDLTPLVALPLRDLELDGPKRVSDYSPLGDLPALERLAITEPEWGPRLHTSTIGWLQGLEELRELVLAPIVDDHDYSPILALKNAERIYVSRHPAMRPDWEELLRLSAGVRRAWQETVDQTIPAFGPDGRPAGTYSFLENGKVAYEPN
jgi:hypothetical protein